MSARAREKRPTSLLTRFGVAALLFVTAILMVHITYTAADNTDPGADGSPDDIWGSDTDSNWYKSQPRTEDDQVVFPLSEYMGNWHETCDSWSDTEARRVVISTVFEPDTLIVESQSTDDSWAMEKLYPIEPHGFHLTGNWQKHAKVKIDVFLYKKYVRHSNTMPHEIECFNKFVGLPGLVLEAETTGVQSTRHSMVVDEARIENVDTIIHTKQNTAEYGSKWQGTIEMSETFWSAARRKWDSWIGVVGGGLALVAFLYGLARRIGARCMLIIMQARRGRKAK